MVQQDRCENMARGPGKDTDASESKRQEERGREEGRKSRRKGAGGEAQDGGEEDIGVDLLGTTVDQ